MPSSALLASAASAASAAAGISGYPAHADDDVTFDRSYFYIRFMIVIYYYAHLLLLKINYPNPFLLLLDITLEDYFTFHSGTHGYIAPEVLRRGTSYGSGADWFSYGCTIFKLLRGHSPFRTSKTKDKAEIDRMTLNEVKYTTLLLFHIRVKYAVN